MSSPISQAARGGGGPRCAASTGAAPSGPSVMRSPSAPCGAKTSLKASTAACTAIAARDFVAHSGELVFEPGVTQRQIQVEIIDDGSYEKEEDFRLEISGVQVN